MNRVKKIIVYLLVAAAAFLMWYYTTPQNFSKEKLVDAYLRGYHAGPARDTLLEYESQSGDTFLIVDCSGQPDYAFAIHEEQGLWRVEEMYQMLLSEGSNIDINYSTHIRVLFGTVADHNVKEIGYKFDIDWRYTKPYQEYKEGNHIVEERIPVNENGIFMRDFHDEFMAINDDSWHNPHPYYICGYDADGNELWRYEYDRQKDFVYIGSDRISF